MTPPRTILRDARRRAGLTLEDLAGRLGLSKGYLSHIETGKRRLTVDLARQLEAALGLEPAVLVAVAQWDATPPEVRQRVRQTESRNQALTRKLREALSNRTAPDLDALRALIESEAGNIDSPRALDRRIPIINKVAAGYPAEFTDLDYPASIADEYIACPDVNDPQAFAARVVGDSMAPNYLEGEIVVFSPQLPTPDGSDCFVRLGPDNETTFKRLFFERGEGEGDGDRDADGPQQVRLQPINPAYAPKMVKAADVTGIYAAAYVIRRVGGSS